LNRLDEAFREAFLALLSGTVHLGEATETRNAASIVMQYIHDSISQVLPKRQLSMFSPWIIFQFLLEMSWSNIFWN
jgi:hypothetical protein